MSGSGRHAVVASAPGRVNLIGEFTDYNDGWVLPFALDRRTTATLRRRSDTVVRVSTTMLPASDPDATVEVALEDLRPGGQDGWAAYVLGVVWAMAREGYRVGGMDIALDTDVPVGAGLSSSAALECAVALGVAALEGGDLDPVRLAGVARRAENDFVGVPTGIMDQTVSLRGEEGAALLLDTRTLEVTPVAFDPAGAGLALLVVDTRVHHQLGGSAYAERRHACERAARTLGVPALRDVPPEALDGALAQLPDDVTRRRVRHVVSEDARVLDVAARLDRGDLAGIGPVLTAAHRSLRDDFEVSCPELDLAVDSALDAGALGARMIGGGFGGSAIALVGAESAERTASEVADAFARAGYAAPGVFAAAPAAGARVEG